MKEFLIHLKGAAPAPKIEGFEPTEEIFNRIRVMHFVEAETSFDAINKFFGDILSPFFSEGNDEMKKKYMEHFSKCIEISIEVQPKEKDV